MAPDTQQTTKVRIERLGAHLESTQCPPTREQDAASSSASRAGLNGTPSKGSLSSTAAIAVVGGLVMDVQATPSQPLLPGGSVPGCVRQCPGGVGRNIAAALATLIGWAPEPLPAPCLISLVGDDATGIALVRSCASAGVAAELVRTVSSARSPAVAVVLDGAGDVAASVADVGLMESAEALAWIRSPTVMRALSQASWVVLDANLSAEAIAAAAATAKRAGKPVWLEPVSEPKALRCLASLPLAACVSPNRAELRVMAQALGCGSAGAETWTAAESSRGGEQQDKEADQTLPAYPAQRPPRFLTCQLLQEAATVLSTGVAALVVTLGAEGSLFCSRRESRDGFLPADASFSSSPRLPLPSPTTHIALWHVPAAPAERIANASGAGDALVAGAVWAALTRRGGPSRALAWGSAWAARALRAAGNTPCAEVGESGGDVWRSVRAQAQLVERKATCWQCRRQ